jgi:hypothetical protein
MSTNGILYFGAQPRSNQTVSRDLAARGINLLREVPTDAKPTMIRTVTSLAYDSYITHFPIAAAAALDQSSVKYFGPGMGYLGRGLPKSYPPFMATPPVVWNYTDHMTPEAISIIRDRYNAEEIVSQGRPALSAMLRWDQVVSLKKLHPATTNLVTPTSNINLNLDAYKGYRLIYSLADLVLRISHYPLLSEGQDETADFYRKSLEVDTQYAKKVDYK